MDRGGIAHAACLRAAVLLVLAMTAAAGKEPATDLRAERESTVERLRAHADWCASQHFRADREEALEALLVLAPDDTAARKALRHKQDERGVWTRPPAPARVPSDRGLHPEAAARFANAVEPFRTMVTSLLDRGDVPPDVRERALADLVRLLPDDAEARSLNGEVKFAAQWVLVETDRSRTRATELLKFARESLGAVPQPIADEATAAERAHGGPYVQVVQNDVVRVLGAQGTAEAVECARMVPAVRALYPRAFGPEPMSVPGFRIVLFPDVTAGLAAIGSDPRFDPAYVKWVAALSAAWAPSAPDVYLWASDAAYRVESALRQSLGLLLRWQFGVGERQGSFFEGLGHWFSEFLIGTHRVYFVTRPEYGNPSLADWHKRLTVAGADWTALARELEASRDWPGLRFVLGRQLNDLSDADILLSFAFARFLIEGHAEALPGLLRDVGSGKKADEWVATHLRATVEGLELRFRRFIRETAGR